jgi:hypothetical protein
MKRVWDTSCVSWEDNRKGRKQLRDGGVDGRIILKEMLNKLRDG